MISVFTYLVGTGYTNDLKGTDIESNKKVAVALIGYTTVYIFLYAISLLIGSYLEESFYRLGIPIACSIVLLACVITTNIIWVNIKKI